MNPAAATAKSTVTVRSERSTEDSLGESINSSIDVVFELLEQNVSWWEQAALMCERIAENPSSGTKEEWQLMGAVYRERAQRHTQFINHCVNARPVRTGRLSIAAPIQNFAHVESSLQLRRHQSNQSYILDGLIGRFGRFSAGRGCRGELRNAVQP
jgi:hypothetical protein